MFWVISVYSNIRNTLPKSGTFLLFHPVYIYIYDISRLRVKVGLVLYQKALSYMQVIQDTFGSNRSTVRSQFKSHRNSYGSFSIASLMSIM